MFGSVRDNVPKVSYVSMLDVWMVMCIIFVFVVIIHFVLVIALIRKGNKKAANAAELLGLLFIPLSFISFNVIYWWIMVNF
jgi:hypothetical protein